MLITTIIILALVIFASVIQFNFKIPSPITIMSIVMAFMLFDIRLIRINSSEFDNLVLLTLPILIAADAMKLQWNDVKKNGISLFFVAVIGILAFVALGVLINDYVLIDYPLSIAAVTLLFCMLAATDPVTVSSVFSNFKVPHRLKILTEGESLFNDAAALIVFSIALVALNNSDVVDFEFVVTKTFSVIFGALGVGIIIGYLTIKCLKISKDALVEASILMLGTYSAYLIAEHFHFSGILSVIVAVLIANNEIQKQLNIDDDEINKANQTNNFVLLKYAITNKDNHETIIKSFDFICMFAASILFASIASVANFEKMWNYRIEILALFLASTLIRGIVMLKFAFVSNNVERMQSVKKHWWCVLTFAGSKGALSILMVHMIPNDFKYKEMFEHVVIGNILLSTFIYAFILGIIFIKNKEKFQKECEEERLH